MLSQLALLSLASLQANAPAVSDPGTWTTAGARTPEIELPRIDGAGALDLASYRGKKLLLIQFASW